MSDIQCSSCGYELHSSSGYARCVYPLCPRYTVIVTQPNQENKEMNRYVILFQNTQDPINSQQFYAMQGHRLAFTNKEAAEKKIKEIAMADPTKIMFLAKIVMSVRSQAFEIHEF